MGWSLVIATERDPEQVTWLSKHCSYELLRDYGCLRAFITEEERRQLSPDSIDEPAGWEERDAGPIGGILARVLARLRDENERLPVHHFLRFVDEDGRRWGGGTQITIPFDGIELTYPHSPIVKLDGGHGDLLHRLELKKYRVRVDRVKLEEFNAQLLRKASDLGLKEGEDFTFYGPFGGPSIDPLVEESEGWVPAEPVLEVLGQRVEVQSEDALAMLEPGLVEAIACCDRAKAGGLPLFWLMG
jgi:hypothetical protein